MASGFTFHSSKFSLCYGMINLITLLRVILLLPLVWVMLAAGPEKSWAALAIFALAGATDFLDGFLARKLKQTSKLGAMLDQICDKIFIIGTLVAMAAAGLLQNGMLIPVFLIIAREFAVTGWREYTAQQGRAIPVDKLGKLKTITQFAAIALILIPPNGTEWLVEVNHLGAMLLWFAATLGLISAWNYFHPLRLAPSLRSAQAPSDGQATLPSRGRKT